MSTEVIGWQDELQLDHRRRLRNASLVSLALHVVVFAAFAISPPRSAPPMPAVLAVDLVAMPPGAGAPPRPRPAPTPPPKAAPEPAPEPVAPPPPPPPKAPVQVLPEEAPTRVRKVVPEPEKPKKIVKAEPKPVQRPRRESELSYEDAMAALDDELGVDETSELLAPAPAREAPGEPADSSGEPGSSAGAVISPELAAWSLATRRRIQGVWVTPPNFRGRGLATHLELRLSVTGEVIGEPRVLRSSGDPYFDDNAVRAVLKASPLPAPPQPGIQNFLFRSEAD